MHALLALPPLALLAAIQACGGPGRPAGSAPAAATAQPPAAAAAQPPAAAAAATAAWRSVARGSASCLSRGRTTSVIRDAEAWSAWVREVSCGGTLPFQDVDFAREAVLAADGEDGPNGCHALRITGVTQRDGRTVVAVARYVPPQDAVCAAVMTHPFEAVAVPRELAQGDVAFDWTTVTGRPAP